ncbi:MAG: hypothetical protein ACO3J6_00585 [Opitutales bacterium]
MELHCPDCGLPIQARDIAPAQGVAVCRFCEKSFPLASCQTAVPFADRNIVPAMTPPKGVDLTETMDGFRLSLSTRSCVAFFLVPFTLAWTGGAVGGIYGTQFVQKEFNWILSLFGLPFLIASFFLIGLTIMTVAGRAIVELANGRFSIRAGAFGVYRTKSADWTSVRSCRLTEETRDRNATGYQVECEVDGGENLKLSVGGMERETALWVTRFLAGRIQRGR